MTKQTYNGWKNYETWSVALTLDNIEYYATYRFNDKERAIITSYKKFIAYFKLEKESDAQGIHYLDSDLDYDSLDEWVRYRLQN